MVYSGKREELVDTTGLFRSYQFPCIGNSHSTKATKSASNKPAQQKEAPTLQKTKRQKHTAVGIRWSSPTQLLIHRFRAYVWQSGRDAQISLIYGRM
jgi:hypothetical protein